METKNLDYKKFFVFIFVIFILTQFCLYAQQTFTDVTAQMGIGGQTGLGHSVGWCDIDNDRDLDIAFSNQNSGGFWLYRNDDSVFTDITSQAGLSGLTAYRIIWAEVTGDTFSDLIVRTWDSGQKLYKNDGNNHFTDITSSSGVTGLVVSAADFDNNGATDLLSLTDSSCYILYNNGAGVFTPSQFISYSNDFQCAVCFDYNLDGKIDIYLGTYGDNPNKLFENLGNDSFVDVTSQAGVSWNGGTSGITAGDYDNDGFIDLYLGNTSSPGCKLFHNNGNGTFSDVTSSAGVTGYTDTRTAAFVDYNNDGLLDIFVSNHDFYNYSNQMYRNNGNGTFTDVGAQLHLSGQWMGDYFGTAWGDFNNDGAIDLFAVGHIDKYVLFRNDNCPGNYLNVRLIGTVSNYNGIGALIKLWTGSICLTRSIIAGEGMHDFHSLPVEFGLGNNTFIDSLIVNWPSGIVQRFDSILVNQFITIVEGATAIFHKNTIQSKNGCLSVMVYPNPFTTKTVIKFQILCVGEKTNVYNLIPGTLNIYDVSGKLVKQFVIHDLRLTNVTWDGMDKENNILSNGVYFCTVTTSTVKRTIKLLLIR